MADWRVELCKRLGWPASANNVTALRLWAASEGMPAESHNPLATSMRTATSYHRAPYTMPFYRTAAEGVDMTARTLSINAYGYPAIRAAFKADRGLGPIWQAVNASSWCKGCQGGSYPVRLHDAMHGLAPGPLAPSGPVQPAPTGSVPEHPWDYSPTVKATARTVEAHAGKIDRALAALRATLSKRISL